MADSVAGVSAGASSQSSNRANHFQKLAQDLQGMSQDDRDKALSQLSEKRPGLAKKLQQFLSESPDQQQAEIAQMGSKTQGQDGQDGQQVKGHHGHHHHHHGAQGPQDPPGAQNGQQIAFADQAGEQGQGGNVTINENISLNFEVSSAVSAYNEQQPSA